MTAPLRKEQLERDPLISEPLAPVDPSEDPSLDQETLSKRPVERIRLEPKAGTNPDFEKSDRATFDTPQAMEPRTGIGENEARRGSAINAGVPPVTTAEADNVALFPNPELQEMRSRWDRIQTAFVDDPRTAVHDADALVASATRRLSEVFEGEHAKLEKRWQSGDNLTTEDLRVALQRYRSFFQRLLSV